MQNEIDFAVILTQQYFVRSEAYLVYSCNHLEIPDLDLGAAYLKQEFAVPRVPESG